VATHDFTIKSGLSSGGYDALLSRYAIISEIVGQCAALTIVRDAATSNMLGQAYIGQFTDGTEVDDLVYIFRGYFYFKIVSAMTDATITAANISFKVTVKTLTDGDFDVVLQHPSSSAIPHQPAISSDYNKTNVSGNGGSVNTSAMTAGNWVQLDLNEDGISWIPTEIDDIFTLGIRSSDDIDVVCPNGFSYITYLNGQNSISLRPILTITIIVEIPTATTQEETGMGVDDVTINGTIVDNGHWLDSYGFELKKEIDGDVTNYVVGGSGNQDVTTFSKYVDGLSTGTYYYRAWGSNEAGKGYGEWVSFEIVFTTVTTEAASVPDPVANSSYEFADGHGTINSSTNATERGFEVKHEYSGDLYGSIAHHIAGFVGDVSLNGTIWEGTLVKTESEDGDFAEGAFTLELGAFPSFFYDQLFAGESYTYRARATIDDVEYFGEWVAFSLGNFPSGVPVGGDDISSGNPVVPIIPIDITEPIVIFEPPSGEIPDYEFPEFEFPDYEFPEFDVPEFELPDFAYPEFPPYNGSWIGTFYYRKPYTKKDLDELRRKCRIFQDNSVEYALVINHNARVMQQFLNMMTTYMDADEYNTFKPIIPTQHLNALAREVLGVKDFKAIINNFISNSIDNANNVNNNFQLIRSGLSAYAYTEDEGFNDITIRTRQVEDNNPDVEGLKKVIDRLNLEMANNYIVINHNLRVLRAILF